jgi:hypothetical protein
VLPVARWTCTLQAPPPAPSAEPSAAPSVSPSAEPSVTSSVSPSTEPSAEPAGIQNVCMGEGEQCSVHADCCGDGVCFDTCIFRRIPAVAPVVSKDQFIIAPPGGRIRGGSGRRHLLKGS